jgi:anti-anti-sigma factor
MGQGCNTLLIDLDGTRIINSIGVSILLEILEKLMDEKGQLAFCNLTPTISKTFEIMGLVQYASVYPDRDAARAAIVGESSV